MIVSNDRMVWTGRAEGKFRYSQDWKWRRVSGDELEIPDLLSTTPDSL